MLNLFNKLIDAFCKGCEIHEEMLSASGLALVFPKPDGYKTANSLGLQIPFPSVSISVNQLVKPDQKAPHFHKAIPIANNLKYLN